MSRIQKTISPVDDTVYLERELAEEAQIEAALARAAAVQREWRSLTVEARCEALSRWVDAMIADPQRTATELAWQMGRPVAHGGGELKGLEERARHMLAIAPRALADLDVGPKEGFRRFIRREPLGVVFVVAPWNYPYLTAVNAVIPALAAGNSVLLKHSSQTPLVAEAFSSAAVEAGLPEGLLTHLHLSHEDVAKVIGDPRVGFVAFTGSVPGGHAVQEAASGRFIATGLELGGKDPAYVRADADLKHAIETVIDGAFYNAGQSCCGIERAYVHADLYDDFIAGAAELVRTYHLGDPTKPETTLGPVVRTSAADFIRQQVANALTRGARRLVTPDEFPLATPFGPYLAPELLVDVTHEMAVMKEETFGPVLGVMKVASDEEALALMNDSDFGLTAAIFSRDLEAAVALGDRVETGTLFLNRCDYLDPALAWTGVKDSGRGCTLSSLGYEAVTRPKSFHLKILG
ncbi:MAG: aldehyde dehydrogenase family protein [Deltaproteobacteria bacterium]|nr:aldehyde dehydrogenase family protein [Deltaproteobacteria bacterium]